MYYLKISGAEMSRAAVLLVCSICDMCQLELIFPSIKVLKVGWFSRTRFGPCVHTQQAGLLQRLVRWLPCRSADAVAVCPIRAARLVLGLPG